MNSPEQGETAEQLLELLKCSGLESKATAHWIKYGVRVESNFLGLISLSGTEIYCSLPNQAIRALGDNGFVECKRKICSVAEFYRSSEVDDPTKLKACVQHYGDLAGKVESLVSVVVNIGDAIRATIAS